MAERRILVVGDVSPLETHGGAARVIREQSRRLAARGHDVTVFCRHPGGAGVPLRGDVSGVPVLHYEVSRAHPLAFAVTSLTGARRRFARVFAGRDWDAVVFHQPFSAVAVASLVPAAARRVYVFHSPAGEEYRLRAERSGGGRPPVGTGLVAALLARLERRALRGCRDVVVLSEFSRGVLARAHGRLGRPVTTVPGGVDVERFHPPDDRARVRAALGFPGDATVLVTVRDLQPRMGLDTLLRALETVRPGRRLLCVIGGSGPLRLALERLAGELGLGALVRFAGHIPEDALPLHYQAADLFVLPTRVLEGFGLVTVEALACATPVVATPVGATPEILAPLDPRLLAAESSAAGLGAALTQALPLAADEGFRRRCRAYAVARYAWDRHLDAFEALLAGVEPAAARDGARS
jgi:glycosyltransferase involved in cell wall biosynthesis